MPTRMSSSPADEPSRAAPAIAPRRRIVSRSTRVDARLRKPGADLLLRPARCRSRLARGTRRALHARPRHRHGVVAVVAARALRRAMHRERTDCSSGTRASSRTAGRTTDVANPRRFRRTIACSPDGEARRQRSRREPRSGSRQAPRQRTPRACRRPAPSRSGRSSTRRSSVESA